MLAEIKYDDNKQPLPQEYPLLTIKERFYGNPKPKDKKKKYSYTELYVLNPTQVVALTEPAEEVAAKKAAGTAGLAVLDMPQEYFAGLGEGKPLDREKLLKQWNEIFGNPALELKMRTLIQRLRNVPLIAGNAQDDEYRRAGWSPELLDKLEKGLPGALREAKRKLQEGKIQIRVQNKGEDLGFYLDEALRGKEPPVFALYGTDGDGNRVIQITQELLNQFDQTGDPQKQLLLFQILFHEILEGELATLVGDRLKHPVMVALESLVEDWNSPADLPSISLVQAVTLKLAASQGMKGYLTSLQPDHPLDFEESFDQTRNAYLFVLSKIEDFDQETLINMALGALTEKERRDLQFQILTGQEIPEEQLEKWVKAFALYGSTAFETLPLKESLVPLVSRLKEAVIEIELKGILPPAPERATDFLDDFDVASRTNAKAA